MQKRIHLENSQPTLASRRDFNKTIAMAILSPLFSSAADAKLNPLFASYGVCTSLGDFKAYKDAGYDYMEGATSRLLMPNESDAKFQLKLDELKKCNVKVVACNSFLPMSLRSVGEDANHSGVLKYSEIVFKRAKLAGVKGIVFGSAGSRKLKDGFKRELAEEQFISLLKKMAILADAQKVEIWIEPLNKKEDNFINTQAQGASIIEKINHPAVGMVCDLFHVARNGETPEDILKTMSYVRHCHIAEKEKRSAPGMKGDDFTPYLLALKKGNYHGSISMECSWDNTETRPAKSLEYLKNQVTAVEG